MSSDEGEKKPAAKNEMSTSNSAASSRPPSAADIVAKLARQENAAKSDLILAPVLNGSTRVRVRLFGIVYELNVRNSEDFSGWALLRITNPGEATVIGRAGPKDIERYFKLFLRIRVVILELYRGNWWAVPAQENDPRLRISGAIPVQMADRVAPFDTVYTRYDGTWFLYEGPDRRHDPSIARALRQSLNENIEPENIRISGVIPAERRAYEMLYLLKHPHLLPGRTATTSGDNQKDKIAFALAHSGAELDAFWYLNPELMAVRFILDGETQTANISATDLSLVSAGVCLSGEDHKFDLASLAGVLRQYRTDEY